MIVRPRTQVWQADRWSMSAAVDTVAVIERPGRKYLAQTEENHHSCPPPIPE